jgi:hypothetical protein
MLLSAIIHGSAVIVHSFDHVYRLKQIPPRPAAPTDIEENASEVVADSLIKCAIGSADTRCCRRTPTALPHYSSQPR